MHPGHLLRLGSKVINSFKSKMNGALFRCASLLLVCRTRVKRFPLRWKPVFQICKAPEFILFLFLLQNKGAGRRLDSFIIIYECTFHSRLLKVSAFGPHLRADRLVLRRFLGDIPGHVYILPVGNPFHIDNIPIPPKAANGFKVRRAGRIDYKMVMIPLVSMSPLGDINVFQNVPFPLALVAEQSQKLPHTFLRKHQGMGEKLV